MLIRNVPRENGFILGVLRGYGGKDDKLHCLTPHLANLTLSHPFY